MMRGALAGMLAFLLGMTAAGIMRPDDPSHTCPTEDSCRADYRGGQWHIVEVTP